MATLVRDALGLLVLVALLVVFASASERDNPSWLRRRGYPPRLYLARRSP